MEGNFHDKEQKPSTSFKILVSSSRNLHNFERKPIESKEDDNYGEFEKLTRTPISDHNTRNEKSEITDEEFEKFLNSWSDHEKSETTDEESYESDENNDYIEESLEHNYNNMQYNNHQSQRKSEMTEEEFDKFINTPSLKVSHGTRSQKKSETIDKKDEKFARTPISKSNHSTKDQKKSETTDDEEFYECDEDDEDDFLSFLSFEHNHNNKQNNNHQSQKKSETMDEEEMTEEEFLKFINTPILKSGHGTPKKSETTKNYNYKDNFLSSGHNRNNKQNKFFGNNYVNPDPRSNNYKGIGNEFTSKKQNSQSFHSKNTYGSPSLAHYDHGNKQKSSLESQPSNIGRLTDGNKNEKEIKVIFHIHLPKDIDKIGYPVVLGDGKELGFWKKSNVKFHKPYLQNPTYWRSDLVTISLPNFSVRSYIQYKYAINIPKSTPHGIGENFAFEGGGDRTLDIKRKNQFAIWKNNYLLPNTLYLNTVHDFAFVDYIYNSIEANNLKDKVMEYQHLLTFYNYLTANASGFSFINNHINDSNDRSREKRLFLCLLLGYYILRESGYYYALPNPFPSGLFLNALSVYKQETLPSGTKDQMYTAIITLVQNNAFQYQFDWLIIFAISAEVDPEYTFLDRLRALKYPNDNLLIEFIKQAKKIRPYIEGVEFDTYIKLAKWLIQLCHNITSLLKLWGDVLMHNNDKHIYKCFIERVRENISYDDAVALEHQFKRLPIDYRDYVSEVFRDYALFLLENPSRKWTNENITSIKNLLHNESLNWDGGKFIQSLDLISQSHTFELLNTFPELLDDWFRSDFSDKEKKIPKICITWFNNLLDTSARNRKSSNESNFVFLVFMQLEHMYPLLGYRKNIWQDLTTIAIERVRTCSESRIFGTTKLLFQIKEQEIRILFLEMIKEMLNKTVQQINEQLITKIFLICGCKRKNLEVPNSMSENILYHIMNRLQSQSSASDSSEYHLNILKARKFWEIIFRATGNVANLHSNPFVQRVRMSVNELGGLLLEKNIYIQLLQKLLKYSDEELFQYFDAAVAKKKALGDAIISRGEIAIIRKLCDNYQFRFDILSKFYSGFCPTAQVTDVNDYKQHMQNSNKVKLKQVLLSDYWAFHEKMLDSAERCYKFYKSQTFRNVFEACIQEDTTATKVEYVAQKLIPIVFEKYNAMCKQLKEWENLKCSDASLLWKNVTNVNAELDLMEGYGFYRNKRFVNTLENFSKIPHWIERLDQLEKVVGIFNVLGNKDDWLSKSIRILKDGLKLGQINIIFEYIDRNLSNADRDSWNLIKELSSADEFIVILKKITEHDIMNLINGEDDHSDKRLIQEKDMVSSIIMVKQFLFHMNKNKIENIADFFDALILAIGENHTLARKIALCNSSNMALQNMYNKISNHGEVTKEKTKIPSTELIDFVINNHFVKFINMSEFSPMINIDGGHFGTISKALWEKTNNFVACKRLKNIQSICHKQTEAFLHELQMHKRLDFCSRIIRILGISFDNEKQEYLLIMQYADSGNLRRYLQKHFSTLTWNDKIKLAFQIVEGIKYLHGENILHRDLHSKNIVIHQGEAKIIDLGTAKSTETETNLHSGVFGVIPYIDPKLLEDFSYKYNEKSDIYSLGVLMWELSSGKPPFICENDNVLSIHLIRGRREYSIPNTPTKYLKLYQSCWDGNPDLRPLIGQVFNELGKMLNIQDFSNNDDDSDRQDSENGQTSDDDRGNSYTDSTLWDFRLNKMV